MDDPQWYTVQRVSHVLVPGRATHLANILISHVSLCTVSLSADIAGLADRRGSVVVSTPAYHAADRGSNTARTRRDY